MLRRGEKAQSVEEINVDTLLEPAFPGILAAVLRCLIALQCFPVAYAERRLVASACCEFGR